MKDHYDLVVIGAGIVGLATTYELQRSFPSLKIAVLEKEDQIGRHQTGHNSGVVHSGLYYKPGSWKARLCISGAAFLREFCQRYDVPLKICGKVVVAAADDEIPRLRELYRRGIENGLSGLRLVTPEELSEIEPSAFCREALHVPETAVVDFGRVASQLATLIVQNGGAIHLGTHVQSIRSSGDEVVVHSDHHVVQGRFLITCAGLFSDRVARLEGAEPPGRIVPFRGEYYRLKPERSGLVRALIYPVPDPRFPFLGVHFTRRISGEVEAGPNAVLALSREGYRKSQISVRDAIDVAAYPAFWKLASKNWRPAAGEIFRSFSKRAFVAALQKLMPEIRSEDLEPGGSGVRAQAVDAAGNLVDDFVIVQRPRALHLFNAPSPAATASLAIGRHLVSLAQSRFAL